MLASHHGLRRKILVRFELHEPTAGKPYRLVAVKSMTGDPVEGVEPAQLTLSEVAHMRTLTQCTNGDIHQWRYCAKKCGFAAV